MHLFALSCFTFYVGVFFCVGDEMSQRVHIIHMHCLDFT